VVVVICFAFMMLLRYHGRTQRLLSDVGNNRKMPKQELAHHVAKIVSRSDFIYN